MGCGKNCAAVAEGTIEDLARSIGERAAMPSMCNWTRTPFIVFPATPAANVLDLVMGMERCSLREAALRLQQRFVPSQVGAPPQRLPSDEKKLVTEKSKGN